MTKAKDPKQKASKTKGSARGRGNATVQAKSRELNAADLLLAWYDRHARDLPWRVGPKDRVQGVVPDPYRIWLSEIMLQQTTVKAVGPYFEAFTDQWPTINELARAPIEDVMAAWAGLGYYSRARNLFACAQIVAETLGGRFPEKAADLKCLPGIGDYTSAAIAAIAFSEPVAVVDGNIERVVARLFAIGEPLPKAKGLIRKRLEPMVPQSRPGEFAEALMDLGATICRPRNPSCAFCPLTELCKAHALGSQEAFPVRAPKKTKPTRFGVAFVAIRSDGAILLRRRPNRGLLGGMCEVPNSDWKNDVPPQQIAPPIDGDWLKHNTSVKHTFTHFHLHLELRTLHLRMDTPAPPGSWWSSPEQIKNEALPSLMTKVIDKAFTQTT